MRSALKIVQDAIRKVHPHFGMDGGTPWEGFVDLRAHDRQYHHDNWQPGDRCKLRESMEQAPSMLRQVGIELPDHAALRERSQEARDTGLLDEQTAGELAAIENDLRGQMNDLDGGNVSLEQIGNTAQELNAVYNAIQEAMVAREDAHETPPQQGEPQSAQTQQAQQQGDNTLQGGWNSTGALPENHPLRQMDFTLDMANQRTTGMPREITDARQITPQILADICRRLPAHGISNHLNRDVTVRGQRFTLPYAVKEMLVRPDSVLGQEMRRRFAAANQDNPWVRRLRECMDVLWRDRIGAGAQTRESAGRTEGEPDFATREDAARYRPQIPADLRAANDAVMRNAPQRFRRIDNPSSDDYNSAGNQSGYNCYLNDLAGALTMLGYAVRPKGMPSGHNSRNMPSFKKVKKALIDGGATIINSRGVQTGTAAASEHKRILEDIARKMPNGTWVSVWTGGHNSSAFLHNGKFYELDIYTESPYGNAIPREISAEHLSERIPALRTIAYIARREDPGSVRGMSEEEIAKAGGGATVVIDPTTFRITPELLNDLYSR